MDALKQGSVPGFRAELDIFQTPPTDISLIAIEVIIKRIIQSQMLKKMKTH